MANNSVLAKMAVLISANTADFNKGLNTATSGLAKFQSTIKTAGVALGGIFAANQLIGIGKHIFSLTAQFQKMSAVLTNTLGSSSKAKKALNDIQKFAAQTPFQITELTSSFVKLANQGFVPTTTELRKLGDLAASTGKGFDQLTEAIIDAQTGEFERLKEFGIRAKKEGDNVTFTFKGVETQTKFTADAIREYVLSLGDAVGVSGSMAAISNTVGGKFSNLVDNLEQLGTLIGNSSSGLIGGFLDLANNALGSLNAALNDQVGALQEEQAELNVLVGAITDVNVSEEVRSALIEELNRKYPDFLKNLDVEKVTNEQLTSRLKDVNEQFLRKIALQAAEERFIKRQKEVLDLIDDEKEARKELSRVISGQTPFTATITKGGAEGNTAEQNKKVEIARLDEKIARIQADRVAIQKELSDKLLDYNKTLGIFNTTNNDYFEGTTKAVDVTRKLGVELAKIAKFTAGTDGGSSNIPGEFQADTFDQDIADKQLDSLVKQAEAVLGLGEAYDELHFNYAQWLIDQDNANAAAEESANKMLALGNIVGQLTDAVVQGGDTVAARQEAQVRALGNATLDIVDLYFKQSIAAAISGALKIGGPAGLAVAGVAIAGVRALFNKAVGRTFSGGGGGSAASVASRSSVSGSGSQTLDVNVHGVIKGKDIYLIGQKIAGENKATKS